MASEKGSKKDKNQNIQVFVRLRPLNQRERDIKSLGVVEVVNNKEIVVRQSQQISHTKKFTFDRAFGPYAKQVEVYQEVVSPLIEEVLAGYNCTVFAYGQTGTGKTHTMVGENSGDETDWQNDPMAGIIPRALSQLFDELRISNAEYTVRVSYLELYNEELFDLLSSSEDNSKLRIYEDITRKGSNIVNGLEEIPVHNKNEVYKIMAQGQERKRVASTLMNAQSSRSHTVFTILVHMKENSLEGEEFVKIGKLNLVDLAGSENISKAGTDNPAKRERARECVNINQSLLTLGRVITALVERHPHIPYRESKLTRILQESLGGRTKTSIIATISPGHKDLEETTSTLEYAHRAKNIQNKPEINQKMTKKAILKEYSEEIDKLKKDLQAARDKNGVYLANDTFAEMTLKDEEQRKEIADLLLKKRALEEERDRLENVFGDMKMTLVNKDSELNNTRNRLDSTQKILENTSNMLKATELHYEEQKYLVSKHFETEQKLGVAAKQLLQTADITTEHVARLQDTVEKRKDVELKNLSVRNAYRDACTAARDNVSTLSTTHVNNLKSALQNVAATLGCHSEISASIQEDVNKKIDVICGRLNEFSSESKSITESLHCDLVCKSKEKLNHFNTVADARYVNFSTTLNSLVETLSETVARADELHIKEKVADYVNQWYTEALARVTSLRQMQREFESRIQTHEGTRREETARRHRTAQETLEKNATQIEAFDAEVKKESVEIDRLIAEKLEELDAEMKETETRLDDWLEKEIRRLTQHVEREKRYIRENIAKKVDGVEKMRRFMVENVVRNREWLQRQVEVKKEQEELATIALNEVNAEGMDSLNIVKEYSTECDKHASAVEVDLNTLNVNIVVLVGEIHQQTMGIMKGAEQTIKEKTYSLSESDRQTFKEIKDNTEVALSNAVSDSKLAMDSVDEKIEKLNTNITSELSSIQKANSDVMSSSQEHRVTQESIVKSIDDEASNFICEIHESLAKQSEVERKYLLDEYRIYSPSGQTPVRQEYRFPRKLAATSPHDRILAKFRAMRQQSDDIEECIILDDESEELLGEESQSTVSENSSTAFIRRSPPPDVPSSEGVTNNRPLYFKSASETDMSIMKREQGKENAISSLSNKKPSRLPTTQKKPLVEKN